MADFIVVFVLLNNLTDEIEFSHEEFSNTIGLYPKPNSEDTKILVESVRESYTNRGYQVIDVCSIIEDGTGAIIWEDEEAS